MSSEALRKVDFMQEEELGSRSEVEMKSTYTRSSKKAHLARVG